MKPAFLCLVALLIGINVKSQTVLFPFGSAWKYLDDGSNQNTAWKSVSFNDTQWKSGQAPLGFGDGDEATVINKTGITTYFRKVVNIQNPKQYAKFILDLKRDDGAIIYINGTKYSRSNLPSGNITYTTYASQVASDDGNTKKSFSVANSAFVNGNNTIAVEIHQAVDANVDLTFDFQLLALRAPIAKAGNDLTLTVAGALTGSVILNGSASSDPDGSITNYSWAKISGPVGYSLNNSKSVKPTVSGMVAGTYVFRLTVTDNNSLTTSDDVAITVNQVQPTLFIDWKNISLPADGLPDARRFANDRLRSSTAFDAFSRTLANDKMKIVVDSKVPVDPSVSSNQYHYRAEFTEWPWRINLPAGTEQWVGWSYYFATDYVHAVSPISIFQNHAGGSNSTPTFQLELTRPGQLKGALGGEIQVINNCSSPTVRKLTTIRPNPGDRLDIILHVIYGRDGNGLLEFWINGTKIHSQIGSTIYPAPENWGGNNKWGIYHHTWTDPAQVQLNITAGHTKFELLMGTLRQLTRFPGEAAYTIDPKATVDPAQDLTGATSSARISQDEISGTTYSETKNIFDVYPSPVKRGDDIFIRGGAQIFDVTLINQTGQILKKYTIKESGNINTADIPPGFYILCSQAAGQNQRRKIIITD